MSPAFARGRLLHRPLAFASAGSGPPEAEGALFRAAAKRVPGSPQLHNVKCPQRLAIAEEMLEGEIAYRDAPWGWMQPVRHALGALLLRPRHLAAVAAHRWSRSKVG